MLCESVLSLDARCLDTGHHVLSGPEVEAAQVSMTEAPPGCVHNALISNHTHIL